MMSRVGGMLAPQVILLSDVNISVPYMLFMGMAFTAAATSCLLPETKGKNLPETVNDAIGLSSRKCQCCPCIKSKKSFEDSNNVPI